jgi:hypothetical protein
MKLIASCTPDSCIGETTSFVHISFYKTATNKLTAPDSITVFGIGRESEWLYNKSLNTSVISLPLDASSEACGFIMKINDKTDTLKFTYSSYPHLISKECGITFFYSLEPLQWSGNAVDTIIIRNKNITTFLEENIRIYY